MHTKAHGRPMRLSDECKTFLVKAIGTLAEWKVPLGALDVCCQVKSYLDARGVNDTKFPNNLPGPDWLKGFAKRKKLTQRFAENVKSSRAEVCAEDINNYFDNLRIFVEGVTSENIFNYDETNVTDDPKAKKALVHRRHCRVGKNGPLKANSEFNVLRERSGAISASHDGVPSGKSVFDMERKWSKGGSV